MPEIIITIFASLLTSFAVGIFLTWKGKQIVKSLQEFPNKKKKKFISRAYIKALKENPNEFYFRDYLSRSSSFNTFLMLICGVISFFLFGHFNILDIIPKISPQNFPESSIYSMLSWSFLLFTIFLHTFLLSLIMMEQ
jgi:hypothetical protein